MSVILCSQCAGHGDNCQCPEDYSAFSRVDLSPAQKFDLHCELTPWAAECKTYED